jgi:hypothetical protein
MYERDQIIQEIMHNPHYLSICKSTARPDLAEDLYQEFLMALLTFPSLAEVNEKEWFDFFCARLISNLYESETSVFYKKYRANEAKEKYVSRHSTYIPDETALKSDAILDKAIDELEKLVWFDKEIFKSVHKSRSIHRVSNHTASILQKKNLTMINKQSSMINN